MKGEKEGGHMPETKGKKGSSYVPGKAIKKEGGYVPEKPVKKDRPLISIVMAVYKPNEAWLCEQLDSLEAQSYRPLELVVCDDCPECPAMEELFGEHIHTFPYRILRNGRNLGSDKTFERLTAEAVGEYIAYCDQDDIWLPEKLERLYRIMVRENAELAYSDMLVIDGAGKQVADSIRKVRKNAVFRRGTGLFPELLTHGFVTGCTMLIRAGAAKAALPFIEGMYHDHWLSLFASRMGKIEYSKKPLVAYRIHGGNQTGVLKGIETKQDYVLSRIERYAARMEKIEGRFGKNPEIERVLQWVTARKAYEQGEKGTFRKLWRLRHINLKITLFELLVLRLPDGVFRIVLEGCRKVIERQ